MSTYAYARTQFEAAKANATDQATRKQLDGLIALVDTLRSADMELKNQLNQLRQEVQYLRQR